MQHSMKAICTIMVMLLIAVPGFSLTNGPIQPEFSSFEPVDASDLVNLPTGDFSYVLPLGDVKGSAGVGYPVVLSYHAGIMHEQEATWTGLGWSLNVGAINRAIRMFPDDYSGDDVISYLHDDGEHGWSVDIGGGWGPVYATVGFSYTSVGGHTWDGLTNVGVGVGLPIYEGFGIGASLNANLRSGTVTGGVSLGYTNGTADAGVGLTFGTDQDPEWYAGGGLKTRFGTFSLSTNGGGYSQPGKTTSGFSMSLSKGGLYHSAVGLNQTIPLPALFRIDFMFNQWRWYYSQMEYGSAYGYLFQAASNASRNVTTNNHVYYNAFSPEPLDEPGEPGEVLAKKRLRSDDLIIPDYYRTNFEHIADKLEYIKSRGINLPSQDIYSLTGQGIGGVFQPFAYHSTRTCYSSDAKTNGIIGVPVSGSGALDSPYSYEKKDENGNIITTYFNNNKTKYSEAFHEGFTFKLLGERALNLVDNCVVDNFAPGYSSVYSNIDQVSENNIMKARNTFGTKIEPIFGLDEDFPEKLTGFVVTDQEGKTYYYTLPLFSIHDVNYVSENPTPPLSNGVLSFNKDHSYRANLIPYATTWLLTAITGPDYIKMIDDDQWTIKERMLPHDGDLGYWVAFHYNYGDPIDSRSGKPIEVKSDERPEKCSYRWRVPFYDSESSPTYPHPHLLDKCNGKYSSSYGMKEITYLKSIETSSEVAYFRTSERYDGLGVDEASYPKFVPSRVDASDVDMAYFRYDRLPYYNKLLYDCSIERASGGIANLDDCIVITLDKKVFDVELFKKLNDGEKLVRVNFKTNKFYKRKWFLGGHGRITKPMYGDIILVKETWGVKYNNDGSLASFNGEMHPERIYADVRWMNRIATNYVKCFYARENPKNSNEILLYATSFNNDNVKYNGDKIRFWSSAIRYRWDEPDDDVDWYWTSDGWDQTEPTITSAWLSGELERYARRNQIARYQKKLDAIAWYSKSEYPYITCKTDPIDVDGETFYPDKSEPEPYRQVKLNYNYDCAPGTHNSVAWNKGRLTLKSVEVEAGKGNEKVRMPPYYFTYQNAGAKYLGHDKIDPWGFRKEDPDAAQDDADLGVNWNLSKIALPSGGSIGIEYERDICLSSLARLYQIQREHPCVQGWQNLPDGNYLTQRNVIQYNPDLLRIYVNGAHELPPGSYVIAFFEENSTEELNGTCYSPNAQEGTYIKTTKKEYESYVYQIVETSPQGGFITINRKIETKPGVFTKIRVLPIAQMRCDGLRVKRITADPGVVGDKQYTVYSYPKPGVLPVLAESAIPLCFKTMGHRTDDKCISETEKSVYYYERILDYMPYSPDIAENYSSGNKNVIYPIVNVYQADKDGDKINGFRRFYFWTPDDKINKGGSEVPLISEQHSELFSVITDRSSIIGMAKRVEFCDNTGDVLYEKDNHYAFSGDLAGQNCVLHESFSNKLNEADKKPLGMIDERSLRVDKWGNVKNIAEIARPAPFLVGVTEKTNGVTRKIKFGMFDARTGGPLVTICENSDNQKRLDLEVPYSYVTNSGRKEDLRRKNIHNLRAGNLTANISHLNKDISDLAYNDIISLNDSIKGATAQDFGEETYTNAPFKQNRYLLSELYNWKGNADFKMPMQNNANWLRTQKITRMDKHGRPKGSIDATGRQKAVIYHPRLDATTGIVSNAHYYECGVYTCDYMERNTLHQGYADYENGWEINVGNPNDLPDPLAETCVLQKHFGNKSLFVQNSFGPTCNFKVSKLQNYILSAWVKISSGSVNLNVEYRNAAGVAEINNWPIKLNQLGTIYAIDVKTVDAEDAKDWKYVELEVRTKEKLTSDMGYVRVWVGNPNGGNAYIDDIRFYPKDALIESFYYDQELGVPITMVDANNKTRHFEYDQFGRQTAVRNSAKELVKAAEYGQTTFLTLTTPNGGELIEANHLYKIKWTCLQSIENAKVEISLGRNVGSDNEVWSTVNDKNGSLAILVPAKNGEFNWWPNSADVGDNCKIKIELMESDYQDQSDNKFSIYMDD